MCQIEIENFEKSLNRLIKMIDDFGKSIEEYNYKQTSSSYSVGCLVIEL